MVQLTMGQKFAFGAGAAYIFSFLFGAVARVLVSTVSTPNMDRVRAAQPGERMAVFKTRGDLHDTNSDGIPLIKEMLFRDETSQSYAVVEGMILGVAALLGIAALLSLKTQMSMKRDSDEQELLMMTAFVIGFTIPMLQFCMQAGPRSMVGWIGADAVAASVCEGITEESVCTVTAAKFSDALSSDTCIWQNVPEQHAGRCTLDVVWKGFSNSDWHALMFTLMVVESLFSWLDTFSALLCGIGFLLLWHLTGTRGTNIVTTKHRTLTLVLGVVLLLNCFFGLLREATWLFEILVGVTGLCILVVLYPAWFIMLGLAFGKVDSLGKTMGLIGGNYVGTTDANPAAATTPASDSDFVTPV